MTVSDGRLEIDDACRRGPLTREPGPRSSGLPRWGLIMVRLVAVTVALMLSTLPAPPCGADQDLTPAGSFSPTGSLAQAREGHTATLLLDGRVLIVGGGDLGSAGDSTTASVELWDPTTGSFSPSGSLSTARAGHTATLLPDGRVLVVGGERGRARSARPLRSAELYDPATGSFAPAGALVSGRVGHTATLLSDGRVLIVGGDGRRGSLASAETWDPRDHSFTSSGMLSQPRPHHTATLLSDGTVLVVGGFDINDPLASAELWDPAGGAFRSVSSPSQRRGAHTATLLPDGRVLVIGGTGGVRATESFDPASGSFVPAGPLLQARGSHTATLLPDGRVLVVGGFGSSGPLASTELWDPESASFHPSGPLAEARLGHTATLLADGRVVVVGGVGGAGTLASAEVWAP
jgi:large repetitive protein